MITACNDHFNNIFKQTISVKRNILMFVILVRRKLRLLFYPNIQIFYTLGLNNICLEEMKILIEKDTPSISPCVYETQSWAHPELSGLKSPRPTRKKPPLKL